MPLDPTNFVPLGPVKSVDLRQFYNLFTGVMSDQPITFRNAVSLGGDQGVTTVPLRIYGAPGQNTNLLDLYTDRGSAQPSFGFSALGHFAWGPGGTAPQDTFLSRISTQHGHTEDTPGLLISPGLEVQGSFEVDGDIVVDNASLNSGGQLSPGLHFGLVSGEGISSQRTSAGSNLNGLDFWTSFTKRMSITSGGMVTVPGRVQAGEVQVNGSAPVVYMPDGNCYIITSSNEMFIRTSFTHLQNASAGPGLWDSGSGTVNGTLMITPGPLYFRNGSNNINSDGNNFFITTPNSTYFQTPSSGYGNIISGNISIFGGTYAIAFADSSHYLQARPAGQTDLLAWTHSFQADRLLGNSIMINPPAGPLYFGSDGAVYAQRYTDGLVGTVLWVHSPNGIVALQYAPEGGAGYFAHSNRSGAPPNEVRAESHLYVPGSIWCTNVQQGSSMEMKTNVVNISPADALAEVLDARVQPFYFEYSPALPPGNGQLNATQIGFDAAAMAQVCPEVVGVDGNSTPVSINYSTLVPILWGAVRRLDERLRALGG